MRISIAMLLTLCVMAFTNVACIGTKAGNVALFESSQTAWPAVEEDFLRGINDGIQDGDLAVASAEAITKEGVNLGTALSDRNLSAVRLIPWLAMEPWATRGIQDKLEDGEIGPGVKKSLDEQLRNFSKVIAELQGY